MEDRPKASLLNRVLTLLVFLVGGLFALFWCLYRAYILFSGFSENVVLIDKGSFYMLGVGLGMLALAFIVIWEQWLLKPVTESANKIFSILALAGVILLFTLPHSIHYFAGSQLKSNGYFICEDASRQWLFVRDIVYIKPTVECSAELKLSK